MGDFFTELLKTFTEPGRKQLTAIVFVVISVCLGFVGFLAFERYTASFRLSRLQKEVDVLTRLMEIEKSSGNEPSKELQKARKALIEHTAGIIAEQPVSLAFVPSSLRFSIESFWKFIASGAIWWVYVLVCLLKFKSKKDKPKILEPLMVGGVVGFIGIFVPAIWWPFFHIFIFPLLLLAAVAAVVLPVVIIVSNLQLAKKRAQTNSCINNLRQIDAAKEQWALENGKANDVIPTKQDVAPYLKNAQLPKCPLAGIYTLGAVAASPKCSVTDHQLDAS